MVPAANLLGFAGSEFGKKLPHVLGVLVETTFGSVVEIILFMVLISRGDAYIPVIKAAILGSILANLLLCLGACFFAGGLRRDEQEFHEAVSEVGGNLMLVAGSRCKIKTSKRARILILRSGFSCAGRLQNRLDQSHPGRHGQRFENQPRHVYHPPGCLWVVRNYPTSDLFLNNY
jgi:hypothetical protein